MQSVFGFL